MSNAQAYRIFTTPEKIVWGRGSVGYLKELPGERAFIVSDAILRKVGVIARVEQYLLDAGKAVAVFDQVEQEPSIATVYAALEQAKAFQPDIIIGLGGGSSMDASKCLRGLYENPQLSFRELMEQKDRLPPYTKTKHVLIPTTSGTGSEASNVYVVADSETHVKYAVLSERNVANVSILDPDMSATMPDSVRIDTGLDALVHAIESFVCLESSDLSRANAAYAIGLVFDELEKSVKEADEAAREHMHYAACLAGISFCNSPNGLAHAIAGRVGPNYRFSHGKSCIIALPYVIRYNAKQVAGAYAEIARRIGYRGESEDAAVDYLIDRVLELMRSLGRETSYLDAGADREKYLSSLDAMAEGIKNIAPTKFNPRAATVEELAQMFRACLLGDMSLVP